MADELDNARMHPSPGVQNPNLNMYEQHPSVSAVGSHLDEEVAKLAHQYYEEEGRPEGRAHEHWLRAERELQEKTREGGGRRSPSTGSGTEEAMHLGQ